MQAILVWRGVQALTPEQASLLLLGFRALLGLPLGGGREWSLQKPGTALHQTMHVTVHASLI